MVGALGAVAAWWRQGNVQSPPPAARREVSPGPGKEGEEAPPVVAEAGLDVREAGRRALAETLGVAVPEEGAGVAPRMDAGAARARTLAALGDLQRIPALHSFAQNFLGLLGRPDVEVGDLVAVVEKDSALCMRILGQANSALVSPERRIEDLHSAVQMLGLERVRKTAQALFTLRDGRHVAEGFDWRHLWMHAIATATMAEELVRLLGSPPPPVLHVAALLHDVGKIALSTLAPEEYRTVLIAAWRDQGRLEELERRRLGVDHREAGRVFAQHAGMPEAVVQAVAHHDHPEQAESFRLEVSLVALANHASKAHGLGFSGAWLGDDDGDFAELPAWAVIEAELGRRFDREVIENQLVAFAAKVRADLRDMHRQV